jgi:DNA-binding CsgD family transcriptional regulator
VGNVARSDTSDQLDMLIRLAALQLIGDKTGSDAIMVLGRAGLDNELIAEIVGTTPATVRSALSRMRRTASSKPRSHGEETG